jgi:hypothetical protein
MSAGGGSRSFDEIHSCARIRPVELEVRHLRLVAEIADAGSMTKAAGRLFLTQSALSHQLRDIEARLETPLFARVGREPVDQSISGADRWPAAECGRIVPSGTEG